MFVVSDGEDHLRTGLAAERQLVLRFCPDLGDEG
jgi:hypothetical protein